MHKKYNVNMRIREVIDEQGITTKQLAEKLHISQSALNQNISGNPSVKVLTSIANALNVPIWELFVSPREVCNQSIGSEVSGYVKVKGTLYEVHSFEDLRKLLELDV